MKLRAIELDDSASVARGRLEAVAGSEHVDARPLGLFALAVGVTLQAGATGAVRAIKMSATLTAASPPGNVPAITS